MPASQKVNDLQEAKDLNERPIKQEFASVFVFQKGQFVLEAKNMCV